ncbi:DUF6233 domain-containing protein [Streptomyces turgidiscabies]|uniref:DUF6233 domain-containing protein n=1 Tax=Streptomyces turgidiscabies TaxID=85558 RepID=UPI0038F7DC12
MDPRTQPSHRAPAGRARRRLRHSGRRRRQVDQDGARRLLTVDGVPACPICRPDPALHITD